MQFTPPLLVRVLEALGTALAQRGARYEIVAAGGSGLLLLGLTRRATRDLDVVALIEHGHYVKAAPLPAELVEALEFLGVDGADARL